MLLQDCSVFSVESTGVEFHWVGFVCCELFFVSRSGSSNTRSLSRHVVALPLTRLTELWRGSPGEAVVEYHSVLSSLRVPY